MTWLDGTLILILVIFLAAGARLGSVWTGALMAGGFFGSFLADIYAPLLTVYFASFPHGAWAAYAALYLGGVTLLAIPGWLLSRATSALYLGVIDGVFGLLTGAFSGFLLITLLLLFILPYFPSIERSKPWKNSHFVRPLDRALEEHLLRHHVRLQEAHRRAAQGGTKHFEWSSFKF